MTNRQQQQHSELDHFGPTINAACRSCGEMTTSVVETFPFCSERCRMADLGKWFNEEYRISRAIKDSDIESGD